MKNLKNLIFERLKADSAAISDTNAENFGDVAEKNSADVLKVENENVRTMSACQNFKNEELAKVLISMESKKNDATFSIQSADVADDVPIYTATTKEIEYWHARVNIHVLDF